MAVGIFEAAADIARRYRTAASEDLDSAMATD